MKKIIKNPIFTFIIGLVLAGSVVGVVAYNYNAKDIGYTPSDSSWEVNNVEEALKDLKANHSASNISLIYSKTHTMNGSSTYTFNKNIKLGMVLISSSNNTTDSSYYVAEITSLTSGQYVNIDNSTISYTETSNGHHFGHRTHAYLIKNVSKDAVLEYNVRYASIIQIFEIE